jgi:eukaryotic-like serine/threonine-protein kinase
VRGSRQIDHRADVYSLGVVLYEMLAGRPPFVRQLYSAVMVDIATLDAPQLARFRPEVPRRIAQVVHRALERAPDDRFADVPSFVRALEEAARNELRLPLGTPPEGLITQIQAQRLVVPQPSTTLRLRVRPTRWWAPILGLFALAAAALGVWRWGAGRAAPPTTARVPAAAPASAPAAAPATATAPGGAEAAPAPPTPEVAPPPLLPAKHAHKRARADRAPARADRSPELAPAPAPSRSARAGKLTVDDF